MLEASPTTRLKLNITVLLFLIVQTSAAVWWAATATADIKAVKEKVDALDVQINSGTSVYLTREQINDILGVRDEQIRTLQRDVTDIKNASVRTELKLDKILNEI